MTDNLEKFAAQEAKEGDHPGLDKKSILAALSRGKKAKEKKGK